MKSFKIHVFSIRGRSQVSLVTSNSGKAGKYFCVQHLCTQTFCNGKLLAVNFSTERQPNTSTQFIKIQAPVILHESPLYRALILLQLLLRA